MNITGKIIKNLRLKKNITLDRLASELNKKFNTSLTGSMLSKWETGKAIPMYEHLKRLALYFDVTTDFLLGFDHYENLTGVNSIDDSDDEKIKIRYSKRTKKISDINKLLENEKLTSKDLGFLEDFINLFISKKDKNLYR